jgi:hypothetical protein
LLGRDVAFHAGRPEEAHLLGHDAADNAPSDFCDLSGDLALYAAGLPYSELLDPYVTADQTVDLDLAVTLN